MVVWNLRHRRADSSADLVNGGKPFERRLRAQLLTQIFKLFVRQLVIHSKGGVGISMAWRYLSQSQLEEGESRSSTRWLLVEVDFMVEISGHIFLSHISLLNSTSIVSG
jgi:hypothetical protein